jgi:hypothetical protein
VSLAGNKFDQEKKKVLLLISDTGGMCPNPERS